MGNVFLPEKDHLSEKIANDKRNSGIEIEQFKFWNNDSDIVNDFTSVKFKDLDFTHKLQELRNFTVQQVINECAIYDIVNVNGLVYI